MAITFDSWLDSQGILEVDDDGNTRYKSSDEDRGWLSPSEVMDAYAEYKDNATLDQYVVVNPENIDYFNQTYGTNFASPLEYWDWVYGPGGRIVSGKELSDQGYSTGQDQDYYAPASGNATKFVNTPLSYDAPDTFMDKFGLYAILAIAGAGLAAGTAGAAGATGFNAAAADAAGLAQMAADAGLTGTAADAFVASGGTLGSTAAGGGGVAGINGWEVFDAPQQFANTTTTTAGPQPMLDAPPVEGPPPGTEFWTADQIGAGLGESVAQGVAAGTNAAAQAVGGEFAGSSLASTLIDWAKNNPLLTSTAVNLAGGFIRGAMAPTPEEQAQAAADARASLDATNRAAMRIPPARWPRPTGRVLRTPGSLPPGLINRAMV